MKAPEQRLLLLSLTLNIFHTLFYYYYCWIRTKINPVWVWEYIVSDNEFVFSNCKKYISLWVGKFFWVTCFHPYSSKIRLRKDKFSWQHFKKISRTLHGITRGILNHFVARIYYFVLDMMEVLWHHQVKNQHKELYLKCHCFDSYLPQEGKPFILTGRTVVLHNLIQLRLKSCSKPACSMSEICDGEDLRQWSWLE